MQAQVGRGAGHLWCLYLRAVRTTRASFIVLAKDEELEIPKKDFNDRTDRADT